MKCTSEKPRICEAFSLDTPSRIELGIRIMQDTSEKVQTAEVTYEYSAQITVN